MADNDPKPEKKGGKIAAFIRKAVDFIRHGMWQDDDEFGSRKSLWLTRQLRIIVYTIKSMGQHGTFIRAAALTFYTIMSLVPILALAFGVIKGFGLDERFSTYLLERFPALDQIADFASSVLDRTKGGIVALTGFVILIWAAVRVFVNVEDAFNNVWEIKKSRSLARKVSAYAAVIFLLPIIWVAISAVIAYIQGVFSQYKYLSGGILYSLAGLAVIWLIFTSMYKIIPNTKVKVKSAAIAGALAAVAFLVFQGIYVAIQNSVNAYNIIYGSFAAVPLFLIWLQTSWIIIMIGAELSFTYQNIDSYRQERDSALVSYDNRRKITVAVMLVIAKHFANDWGLPTSEEISKYLKLPIRIVRDVISDLEAANLIVAIRSEESDKVRRFLPAHEVSRMTFYGVLEATESTGTNVINPGSEIPEMEKANSILEEIKDRVSKSDANAPLLTLLEDENSNNWKWKRS